MLRSVLALIILFLFGLEGDAADSENANSTTESQISTQPPIINYQSMIMNITELTLSTAKDILEMWAKYTETNEVLDFYDVLSKDILTFTKNILSSIKHVDFLKMHADINKFEVMFNTNFRKLKQGWTKMIKKDNLSMFLALNGFSITSLLTKYGSIVRKILKQRNLAA